MPSRFQTNIEIAQSIGDIFGYPPGSLFKDRDELSQKGVHLPLIQGIHSLGDDQVFSIILSGGYEDDEDHGEYIIYTGQGKGGKTERGGKQVGDQEWKGANLALKNAIRFRMPVRVIRGHSANTIYAPQKGYRYDGLYNVVEAKEEKGIAGYKMCKFRLEQFRDEGRKPYVIPIRSNITSPRHTGSRASRIRGSISQPSSPTADTDPSNTRRYSEGEGSALSRANRSRLPELRAISRKSTK